MRLYYLLFVGSIETLLFPLILLQQRPALRWGRVSAFQPPQRQRQLVRNILSDGRKPESRAGTAFRMLPTPPSSFQYNDDVIFFQRATKTRIVGRDQLELSIKRWEEDFRTEVNDRDSIDDDIKAVSLREAQLQTCVASTVSPTTLLLRWNLTYVDPSVAWLVSLADTIPGWTPEYRSYTEKASEVRKFSYSALGKLFADAIATGKLRIPLACIEGTATCEFREDIVEKDGTEPSKWITSIAEDLAYAQDLNRGALSNRVCARDLQFFLEVARKPPEYWDSRRNQGSRNYNDDINNMRRQYDLWEDLVTESLPWRSVPGMMDPLYIEGQSEEDLESNLPLVFGTLSVVLVLVFASWVAPNLI
eukprot:CAMPEP_0197184824 /NCGR_PEP_ID=MMETSP1423-20130617/10666_1 /TAXON_ID=476441 /ORGANISM="Pseudo-nitzschia heimii, Strain UNC1101" /LENGTH=361 /DNA_ID=CAMNT_0042635741 /DNA_START=138 /DNA_END=1220 /DNA_ORIENTATION=+